MEKLFSINKWSVGLCAVIIAVFAAVQFAGNEHLKAVATLAGVQVFTWQWLGAGRSHVVIDKAEVIKRSETDAVVQVKARQTIEQEAAGKFIQKQPEIACSALLTFYRADKDWILAKVEFR
jgi:acyl-coenzyme A thioesterase PaaI-like protein